MTTQTPTTPSTATVEISAAAFEALVNEVGTLHREFDAARQAGVDKGEEIVGRLRELEAVVVHCAKMQGELDDLQKSYADFHDNTSGKLRTFDDWMGEADSRLNEVEGRGVRAWWSRTCFSVRMRLLRALGGMAAPAPNAEVEDEPRRGFPIDAYGNAAKFCPKCDALDQPTPLRHVPLERDGDPVPFPLPRVTHHTGV